MLRTIVIPQKTLRVSYSTLYIQLIKLTDGDDNGRVKYIRTDSDRLFASEILDSPNALPTNRTQAPQKKKLQSMLQEYLSRAMSVSVEWSSDDAQLLLTRFAFVRPFA